MNHRKLRIAWSVAWSMVAALLLVLWMRSFSNRDSLFLPYSRSQVIRVSSVEGQFVTRRIDGDARYEWTLKHAINPGGLKFPSEDLRYRDSYRIRSIRWQNSPITALYVPHWIPLALAALLATSAWLPYRFSLRALLIVTTLMSLALGTLVWMVHRRAHRRLGYSLRSTST